MKSIFTGASINGEHSLHDWKCVINNEDVISSPEPNTLFLEVPGRNGRLDLTESLTGDVTYQNRELKLQLVKSTKANEWEAFCQDKYNRFHGKKVEVVFDEDPEHFFVGRATISETQRVRNAGSVLLVIDAEPYRYAKAETICTFTGAEEGVLQIELLNDRMWVSPEISVDVDCELVFGDITWKLLKGTQTVSGFVLTAGINKCQIRGAGSVTFTYRKGCL